LYLVRFKNQTADTDKWLPKEKIQKNDVLLRRFRAKKRSGNGSGIRAILLEGASVSLKHIEK
jgi:hypothetical protein